MISFFCRAFIVLCLIVLIHCDSGLGTSVPNPPTSPTTTASAVAALFASRENADVNAALKIPARLLDLWIRKAHAQGEGESCGESDPACTCEHLGSGQQDVSTTGSGSAGTYGSAATSVTLEADDFCTGADGSENSGTGPDGQGLFASFTLEFSVSGRCTTDEGEEDFSFGPGSTGVFRNSSQDGATPAYFPQIYGTFVYTDSDGNQTEVDCTLYLLEDGTKDFAECSGEDGEVIVQDEEATCSFGNDS